MMSRAVVFALVLFASVAAYAQSSSSPIDGVWRISEVVATGANAGTIANPQPSLVIFARGHYSWVSVTGTTPRKGSTPAAPGKLTDAEKMARYEEWAPLTANSGTFEVKGSTLTRRAQVAKNVGVMNAKNPIVQEFKIEGNTLWLTDRSAPGQPVSESRTKLTRVQ